jgi:Dolichyl-phosphate-mannose-protein mannosyltransferase
VFVPLAAFRFVDGDEGVYAYAARLVRHGRLPYRDFFYEQMPLLPFVYGGWTAIWGDSWYAVRGLSVVFALAAGGLVYAHVAARHGRGLGLVTLALYALSGLVLGYFTIVKTFALATLLLLGALIAVEGRSRSRWLLAGLLAGLAVDTRLVFAAAVPALAVAARRRLPPFLGGLALGLVPSFVLLALAPHQFVFDNLRYHGEKTAHGLVGDPGQKARTAANLVGFGQTDHAVGLQFALLLILTAVALWLLRRRVPLAAGVGALLGLACFLPTPTYVQYFCVVVPFMALTVAEAAAGRRAALALGAMLVPYAAAAGFAFAHDVETSPLLEPSVASVNRVSDAIERRSHPGERVLASWPGYLFPTHAEAFPGYTNHFAPAVAAHVSEAEARRVHVVSDAQLEADIRARRPRLVVFRNWVTTPPFATWEGALRAGRYRLVQTVETAKIYER